MHGGMSPDAPKGNKNALKHGHYSAEVIAQAARDCEGWEVACRRASLINGLIQMSEIGQLTSDLA
jgi:hypothetical protein